MFSSPSLTLTLLNRAYQYASLFLFSLIKFLMQEFISMFIINS